MGTLLFRLDDVTPEQNWENFERLHDLFRRYSIAPVIGVVPQNKDSKLRVGESKEDYVAYLKKLQEEEGWLIAQHGYTHTYVNRNGGMLKVNRQSEFAGLSGEEQRKKLGDGQQILQKQGICAKMFMAPAHAYDKTTLKVLKELGFAWVTDGYTDHVYQRDGLVFIPCTVSKPIVVPKDRVNTVCYHPNMMTEEEFTELDDFLQEHGKECMSFDQYLQQLEDQKIPEWNLRLALEQQKNMVLRRIKHLVARNALCQAYFQHRQRQRAN